MDRFSVRIVAFVASVVVSTFVVFAWAHTSMTAWLLTRTDLVHSPGGTAPLVTSHILLAIGGVGAVMGAGLLLFLVHLWTVDSVRAAEAA